MRTLFIMTVFLILVWFTDGSEGFCSSKSKKSNSRRAFFSKRSLPSGYEENTKYNCAINVCLPGMEKCTKNNFKRHSYQFRDELKKEDLEIQCVILFAKCAVKCMNNW